MLGADYLARKEFRSNRKIVMAAVNKDGWALEFASANFKADRDIVLAAVNQAGFALEFATNKLRSDREIVLAAVNQDGYALQFASEEMHSDCQIVLAAVKRIGSPALDNASEELRGDAYLQRLAMRVDMSRRFPIRVAFLRYARDLREAQVKAQVDLWLTTHDDGAVSHWVDATHRLSKARKRARTE